LGAGHPGQPLSGKNFYQEKEVPLELYIIRHAQSTNNALVDQRERVSDPLLTEIAERQAQLVAVYLAKGLHLTPWPGETNGTGGNQGQNGLALTRLYCSAMWRALQTAEAIGQALDLTPEVWLDIHEQGGIFLDQDNGSGPVGYPGKNRNEILARFPHFRLPAEITAAGWWRGGYEDWPACQGRAIKVARQLKEWADSDERIGLVSHGGFIDVLLKALLNQLPSPHFFFHHDNTAITRLDFSRNGHISLRYLNRVDHLPAELIT
jgi:broad specificity phosphatase PhoE